MSLKFTGDYLYHDDEEWYKIERGIVLSFQNWHEEFDKFWSEHSKISKSCTLMGSFWSKYIMFELKYYRGVIFDSTEDWWKTWRKTEFVLSKMTWRIFQIFVHRLKNRNFILESKMAELNQNKNQPDAVWKLYFTLEINE